jgi:hypothetical protein
MLAVSLLMPAKRRLWTDAAKLEMKLRSISVYHRICSCKPLAILPLGARSACINARSSSLIEIDRDSYATCQVLLYDGERMLDYAI